MKFSVLYIAIFKNELLTYGSSVRNLHENLVDHYKISYDYLAKLIRDGDGFIDIDGIKIYRIRRPKKED